MSEPLTTVLVLLGLCTSACMSYLLGIREGRKAEKARAERLCRQALNDRLSASVRRVWNSIANDRTNLISEDEFFGGP